MNHACMTVTLVCTLVSHKDSSHYFIFMLSVRTTTHSNASMALHIYICVSFVSQEIKMCNCTCIIECVMGYNLLLSICHTFGVCDVWCAFIYIQTIYLFFMRICLFLLKKKFYINLYGRRIFFFYFINCILRQVCNEKSSIIYN